MIHRASSKYSASTLVLPFLRQSATERGSRITRDLESVVVFADNPVGGGHVLIQIAHLQLEVLVQIPAKSAVSPILIQGMVTAVRSEIGKDLIIKGSIVGPCAVCRPSKRDIGSQTVAGALRKIPRSGADPCCGSPFKALLGSKAMRKRNCFFA